MVDQYSMVSILRGALQNHLKQVKIGSEDSLSAATYLLIVGNHRNRKLQSVCPIGKEDPETLERGDKKKIRRGGGRAAEGRGGGQFNKG
ncbi:hypothetical protein NC653_009311 [Populus alba x Populus x berolinensis]|uniref:Uncharacterized protein n=1 Tax=Populus alba x Populus x berolinensis TaxID=444605 RepID=A0AAD6R8S9_9ROSI|nr:hypothetical protein NC653_009311 [Populus alba x Populus x berolinensis]